MRSLVAAPGLPRSPSVGSPGKCPGDSPRSSPSGAAFPARPPARSALPGLLAEGRVPSRLQPLAQRPGRHLPARLPCCQPSRPGPGAPFPRRARSGPGRAPAASRLRPRPRRASRRAPSSSAGSVPSGLRPRQRAPWPRACAASGCSWWLTS